MPILGIKRIDNDHKALLFFLAQINGDIADTNITLKVIMTFLDYSAPHFEREELYMAQQGYLKNEYDAHIVEHRRLAVKINHLLEDFKITRNKENILEIKRDFLRHIATYDTVWAEWTKRSSPGMVELDNSNEQNGA